MLGGGDKGASGAIVKADSVDILKQAVDKTYPERCPEYSEKYAVHVCKMVEGVKVFDDLL
jgi:galactokinase